MKIVLLLCLIGFAAAYSAPKFEDTFEVQRIDTDELTEKYITKFNEIVDRIISRISENRFINPTIALEIIDVIKHLRDRKVDFVRILNDKFKNVKGAVLERIKKFFEDIKSYFDKKDQSVSFADVDEEKQEKLEKELKEGIDEMIDVASGKRWPRLFFFSRIAHLVRECVRFGLDVQRIVFEKLAHVDSSFRDIVINFIHRIFPDYEDKKEVNHSVQRIDQDEVTEKIIQKFNEIVDKIIERIQNNNIIRHPELIGQIVSVIDDLRNRHVDVFKLLNERLKKLKEEVQGHAVAFFNFIKRILGIKDAPVYGEEFSVVQHIDQDEVTEKVISKFNEVVDKIIEKIEENKIMLHPELIGQIVKVINELRNRHVDVFKLLNERLKKIKESVRGHLVAFFDFIKRIIGIQDAVAFSDEAEVTKEEVREQIDETIDEIEQKIKDHDITGWPSILNKFRKYVALAFRIGLNLHDVIFEKIQHWNSFWRTTVWNIVTTFFPDNENKKTMMFADDDLEEKKQEIKQEIDDTMDKMEKVVKEGKIFEWPGVLRLFRETIAKAFDVGLDVHDMILDRIKHWNFFWRNAVKNIVDFFFKDREDNHSMSFADEETLEEKKEKIKDEIDDTMTEMEKVIKGGRIFQWPRVLRLFRECVEKAFDVGLDVHDMILDRIKHWNYFWRSAVERIVEFFFKDHDDKHSMSFADETLDDKKEKIKEDLDKTLDKITDKANKHDIFGWPSIFDEFRKNIHKAIEAGLEIHDMILDKIKNINQFWRNRVVDVIRVFIPDFDKQNSLSFADETLEEKKEKIKEDLGKTMDKIVDKSNKNDLLGWGSILKQFQEHLREAMKAGLNVVDMMREKVAKIEGFWKGRITDAIKVFFPDFDKKQSMSFADDDLEEKKEQIKEELKETTDKVMEKIKNGRIFFDWGLIRHFRDVISKAIQIGLDIHEAVFERMVGLDETFINAIKSFLERWIPEWKDKKSAFPQRFY